MTKNVVDMAKETAKHAAIVRRKDAAIRALLEDDGALDDLTLRECRLVIERARQGHTMAELLGYLGYRRRIAKLTPDKERVRRVAKALRTNRWGLLDVVQRAQLDAETRLDKAALGIQAHSVFHEQIASANALIPPNKRGRGSGGRRGGRKDYRQSSPHLPGTLI